MTKKITFSLLAIIVSGCLILSAGFIGAAVYLLKAQKAYSAPTVEPSATPTVDEQMDEIQDQVLELRGLELKNTLNRDMMTTAELQDVVVNDFFKDYTAEDAKDDVSELSVLGLVQQDFDLLQFYKDLYAEQIAGYYDSETKEMYVISDEGFGGLERMTYAHEFTHVLQDQTYDLENGLKLNDDYCETDSEYCTAVSALVEGDATLSEQYWFLTDSTDQDKTDVSDFQSSYESPVYDSAPAYMKEDFLFPYSQGFDFVNTLYGEDGWASVDAAYLNPPVSTEQILHPEKYPDEKPVSVELPDLTATLGEDWSQVDYNTMGEWYSYLILAEGIDAGTRLDATDAATATAGWGGDMYAFYDNPSTQSYLLVWRSTWDTSQDADEFFASSREYGQLRWDKTMKDAAGHVTWGDKGKADITIRQNGSDVLWIISNDSNAYKAVLAALGDFND